MKTTLQRNQDERSAQRLLSAAAAIALFTALFLTGCASSRERKSSDLPPTRMTVLTEDIEPLRQQFNADKDKLRVLALFSPT